MQNAHARPCLCFQRQAEIERRAQDLKEVALRERIALLKRGSQNKGDKSATQYVALGAHPNLSASSRFCPCRAELDSLSGVVGGARKTFTPDPEQEARDKEAR